MIFNMIYCMKICSIGHLVKITIKEYIFIMDRKYFMDNLKHISDIHGINVDDETIDKFINASIFRIISKGEVIASIGDNTSMAGLVLSGITRCYYIDNNGNDITRGFDTAGYLCMDEGLYGYSKRICMWEVLEESTIMFCETSIVKKVYAWKQST